MIRKAFLAFLLFSYGIGAWQHFEDIGEAFNGPSKADEICDEKLPGNNWSGQIQVELEPNSKIHNVSCSQEVVVVVQIGKN